MNYYDILFARKMAGGQGEIITEGLSVTENGTYTAPEGKAYTPVVVNVPTPEDSYQLKSLPIGAISTITDGSKLPMPSLKVGIEPIQEGSGDPSPENIRPISGFTETNVTRCGKNLVNLNINATHYSGIIELVQPISKEITISAKKNDVVLSESQWLIDVVFKDGKHNYVGDTGYTYPFPQTIQASASNPITQIRYRSYGMISGSYDIQVEFGTTATAYEPYNGSTITIQFGDTYYGGKLDVVSGVLTVDWVGIKGVTVARVGATGSGVKYADTTFMYTDLVQNTTTISDRYVQINTSESGASGQFRVYNGEFTIYDDQFTDLATAQSLLNDVEFCYELATPQTIQLTPTMVKSLLGTNNIWADTGDVLEGSYFKEL